MPINSRDIFVVIRARDQASNVFRGMATSAMNDFDRISSRAKLQSQQSANQMATIRNRFGQQLLQLREKEIQAQRAGDTKQAAATRRVIQDQKMLRDQRVLNLQQQQIADRQSLHSAMVERQRRKELMQTRAESVRTGGAMIAGGAAAAIFGIQALRAFHSMALGAAEYERQAALTLTQTVGLGASVESLQGISTRVASAIGTPLEQLQPALYDIFSSMNVSMAESEILLTAFAKEAVAGQVSIQDASRATIGIMNAYQIPIKDVNKVLDFQFQLVKLGVGTFAEFATTIGRSIPSAVRAGQTYETLGAMLAFMTRSGMSAAMATASAGRALDAFANPSVVQKLGNLGDVIAKDVTLTDKGMAIFEKSFRNASIQVADANGKFRNIVAVVGELSVVLNKLPPVDRVAVLKEIFKGAGGTIQAMRFYNLAIKNFGLLNFLLKEMGKSSGAAETAYQQMAKTTSVETERLSNNFKILKNSIGAQILPALNDLIDRSSDLIIKYNELDPSQRKLIANTALYGSVLLTLAGALVAVAGVIKVVGSSLAILNTSMATGALAANGLGLAIGAAAAVFGVLNYNIKELRERGFQNGRFLDPASWALKTLGDAVGLDTDKFFHFGKSVGETLAPMSDARKAMAQGTLQTNLARQALGSNEAAMGFYSKAVNKTAGAILDFNHLTADQQKVVDQVAQQVNNAIPAFEGYHKQQDAMKEAASRLAEAQHDLNVAVGRGATGNDTLSASSERVHDAEVSVTKAKIALKNTTGDTTLANIRLKEAQHNLARAQQAGNKVDGSTVDSRERVREATKRVKEAEEAYRQAKGVTAASINKNLAEEVKAYEGWARNTQKLLKRGADPKFVQALSEKGPEYVAAYVRGSNKEMLRGGELWARREAAKASVTKKQSELALGYIQTMVKRMNQAANGIKNVGKGIIFTTTFKPPKGLVALPGGGAAIMTPRARGGPIDGPGTSTSDSIHAKLSKGEYVVNAKATQKHRPLIEAINRDGLPGFAGGGAVDFNASGPNPQRYGQRIATMMEMYANQIVRGMQRKFALYLPFGGPGNAAIKSFIQSTDRLPYHWGHAGPYDYDCSGLVGAVYGMMRGDKRAGHGARYFTTGTIGVGIPGLRPGLGGTLQIGVTPGRGHMAGRYGGLGFEAESTATGIKIGTAASKPESFARHFSMARGGYIDPREMKGIEELIRMGVSIGGDADKIRAEKNGQTRVFDQGGWLAPGLNLVRNNTGKPEHLTPSDQSELHVHFHGTVIGGKQAADQVASDIQQALLRKKRRTGGVDLGLK